MTTKKSPTLVDALIPVVSLILMLAMSVYLFGSDSSGGPNQIVLILGAAAGIISAVVNRLFNPHELEALGIGLGVSAAASLSSRSTGLKRWYGK